METPTETTVDSWISLVKAHALIYGKIETALKDAQLPKLEWYDILWELEKTGDKGVRPFELRGKLLIAQYSMSRLVDKLEQKGYLTRSSSEDDGRGQELYITKTGIEIRQKMWSIYSAALQDALGTKISDNEAKQLAKILAKVID